MDRLTRSGLLVLLGAVTLVVSVTDAHLAYVRPGFRPFLLGAAVVLLVLGVFGPTRGNSTTRSVEPAPSAHEHEHATTPRVAWLLLLPVAVMFLVAPPALGAFTAARQAQQVVVPEGQQPLGLGPNDPGTAHRTMQVLEYSLLALADEPSLVEGRLVRLTGFVTPREGGGWYVSSIGISCCAADAVAYTAVVDGPAEGLAPDQWVQVIGTWAAPQPHPTGGYPEAVIAPRSVTLVEAPTNPYQG